MAIALFCAAFGIAINLFVLCCSVTLPLLVRACDHVEKYDMCCAHPQPCEAVAVVFGARGVPACRQWRRACALYVQWLHQCCSCARKFSPGTRCSATAVQQAGLGAECDMCVWQCCALVLRAVALATMPRGRCGADLACLRGLLFALCGWQYRPLHCWLRRLHCGDEPLLEA